MGMMCVMDMVYMVLMVSGVRTWCEGVVCCVAGVVGVCIMCVTCGVYGMCVVRGVVVVRSVYGVVCSIDVCVVRCV